MDDFDNQTKPQLSSSTAFEFDSTDDDISLGPDDQLSKWYTDLQETCHYQTEKMRVFLSFMDNKSQINNHLEKSKLAQLRIAFTNLLAGKSSEIKTDDIQKFLSTNAYFYLHLPWDNKMCHTTKSDGICGQEWLSSHLKAFFVLENKSASLLYLYQKLIKDAGFRLIVHTDSVKSEADFTDEVMRDEAMKLTLVRPVIHATKLEILNG
jgi:hypothetical protein